jgi:hypothetical protein
MLSDILHSPLITPVRRNTSTAFKAKSLHYLFLLINVSKYMWIHVTKDVIKVQTG